MSRSQLINWRCRPRQQCGVALIVSLVMLVVITIIGIAVMSGSRLELLMANNTRYHTDAAIRAEAALRDGEIAATAIDPSITFAVGSTLPVPAVPAGFAQTPLPADPRNPSNWNGALPAVNATTPTAFTALTTTNQYVVEYMGCRRPDTSTPPDFDCGDRTACSALEPCIDTYRVWGYATDNSGSTRIAHSVFVRRQPGPTGIPFSFRRIAYAEITNDQPPNP